MTEEAKIVRQARPSNLKLGEHHRNTWCVISESGTTTKDLLESTYWAHLAAKFRPSDRIEVEEEDGSSLKLFYVRSAGNNWAKVTLLEEYEFDAVEEAELEEPEFKVEYKGKIRNWCVLRMGDGAAIKENCKDKQEAQEFLKDYIKVLAA